MNKTKIITLSIIIIFLIIPILSSTKIFANNEAHAALNMSIKLTSTNSYGFTIGSSVQISGSGFLPNSEISLIMDTAGIYSGVKVVLNGYTASDSSSCLTDESGDFAGTFMIPLNLPYTQKSLLFEASEYNSEIANAAQQSILLVPPTTAAVTFTDANPNGFVLGSNVQVSGSGFTPNSELEISVQPSVQQTTQQGLLRGQPIDVALNDYTGSADGSSCLTDASGDFSGTFTMPPNVPYDLGKSLLSVYELSSPLVLAQETVQVPVPTITSQAGTKIEVGSTTQLQGQNFPPDSKITLFGGVAGTDPSQGVHLAEISIDDSGSFIFSYTVPYGARPGIYYTFSAFVPGAPSDSPIQCTIQLVAVATITLTPTSSYLPGSTDQISGSGFTPNSELVISMETSSDTMYNIVLVGYGGSSDGSSCISDGNGDFSGSFVIPPDITFNPDDLSLSFSVYELNPPNILAQGVISTKAPVISLPGPEEGGAGSSVQIEGGNFAPNSDVEIYFELDGFENKVSMGSAQTDASGNFFGTFTIPTQAQIGAFNIVAVFTSPGNVQLDAFVQFQVVQQSPSPSITFAPNIAAYTYGQTVQVSGSDFPSDTELILVLSDPYSATVYTTTLTLQGYTGSPGASCVTDANGDFSGSFVVPSNIVFGYGLQYSIMVSQFVTMQVFVSADFPTASPFITLPGLGVISGNTVQFSGGNFLPNSEIEKNIDINGVNETVTGSASSDSTGAVSGSFTVPSDLPPGEYTFNAWVAGTGCGVATLFYVLSWSPNVVCPSSGAYGSNLQISGSGFVANSELMIRFDDPTDVDFDTFVVLNGYTASDGSSCVTDGNGDFSGYITVPSSLPSTDQLDIQIYEQTDTSLLTYTYFVITPAEITLNPTAAVVGSTVQFTGSGFVLNSGLQLWFVVNGNGQEYVANTASSDANGDVSGSFTVPTDLAPGPYTFVAFNYGTENLVTTYFQVLAALAAPTVTPTPGTVDQGQTYSLTSTAVTTGTAPYTFEWFEKAPGSSTYSLISDASSTGDSFVTHSFVTSTLTATGTWSFILQVTDNTGVAVNSTAVSVTVNPALAAPTVTPTPGTVDQDQTSVLTSTLITTGTSPYSYQWMWTTPSDSSFSVAPGVSNSASYSFATTTSIATGVYTFELVVTDHTGASATSSPPATVKVNSALAAPTVSASPGTVDQGQTKSLTSTAVTTGTAPYTYKWFEKAPEIPGSSYVHVGSNSPSFDFVTSGFTAMGVWSFELQVTDSAGEVVTSSSASVTVNFVLVSGHGFSFTGGYAWGVAATPDGKYVYVANFGSDSSGDWISVIDTSTNTVTATINDPYSPYMVAISPDGKYAYAMNYNSVSKIDTSTNTVTYTTATLPYSCSDLVVSPDGNYVYVANLYDVTKISTSTGAMSSVLVTDSNDHVDGLAVTPNGEYVYVATTEGAVGVAVINTSTMTVTTTIPDPRPGFPGQYGVPYGVAMTPSGIAYVDNYYGSVLVIDTATNEATSISETATGMYDLDPTGMAVSPNGAFIYFANANSDQLTEWSTATNTVTATYTFPHSAFSLGIVALANGYAYVTDYPDYGVWVIQTNFASVLNSCNSAGTQTSNFDVGVNVYASGTGFAASTTYNIYLVPAGTLTKGAAFPKSVSGASSTITTDGSGNIPTTLVYTDASPGTYVLVVDFNGNGIYDAGVDPVWNVITVQVLVPVVSVSPSSSTIDAGQPTTITATPSGGSGTYSSYQWFVNGVVDPSSTSSSYSFSSATEGTYLITATVTDSSGVTSAQSSAATLTVNALPTVIVSPSFSTVDIDQNVKLTANPSGGSGTYTSYQWYIDGSPIPGASGAAWSTDTVNSVVAGTWSFTVTVTDSNGVTSAQSEPAVLTVNPALSVTVSPASVTVDANQVVTLTATASGGSGIYSSSTGYQWYVNGSLQSGQTASTFSYSPASSDSYSITSYSITATVADSLGTTSAMSPPASVTVLPPLSVSVVLSSSSIYVGGGSVDITATVSGDLGPATGQVQFYESTDGVYFQGLYVPLTLNSSGSVTCSWQPVDNVPGTYSFKVDYLGDGNSVLAESNVATLTAVSPPVSVVLSSSSIYVGGGSVDITATVSGDLGPATGQVQFYESTDGVYFQGLYVPLTLNSSGSVTCSWQPVDNVPGTYSFKVDYLGDGNSVLATSDVVALTVTPAQYQVTFDQTGVGANFLGTVVTVDGTNYARSDLPITFWWNVGSTHTFAYASPLVVRTLGGVPVYAWSSTTGLSTLQSDSLTVSGSGSVTGNYAYFKQYGVTFNFAISDVSSGYQAPSVSYYSLGTLQYVTAGPSATVMVDSGTTYTYDSTLGGSGSSQRWQSEITPTGTISSSATIAPEYYHQYEFSASYSVLSSGDTSTLSSSVTLTATSFGSALSPSTLSKTATNVWLDAGTSWSVNDPIVAVSGSERWDANGIETSGTVNAAGTIDPLYYHQFQVTFQYNIANTPAGTPSNPTATYTQFGVAGTPFIALQVSPPSAWVDAGSSVIYTNPIAGVSGERWMVSGGATPYIASSSLTGSVTLNPTYYHQYDLKFAASGLDSSAQGTVVSVTVGTNQVVNLVQSQFPYDFGYVPAGTTVSYTFTSSVASSTAGEQFVLTTPAATPASGFSLGAAITVTGSYQTQYYLTVTSAYGTTTGSGWYNAGETAYAGLTSGTVSGGTGTQYVFDSWGSGASGTNFAQSNSIVISSPLTATANWQTEYLLTVSSAYGTASGSGWYLSGFSAYAGLNAGTVAGATGTQWVFTSWTGGASGNNYAQSNPITMNGPITATCSWQTQYQVTFTENGVGGGAGSNAVLTIGSTPYAYNALPSSLWVNSGTTFSWTSTIAGGLGTQFVLTGSSGFASPIAAPGTDTATYQTQYEVTFNVSPSGSGSTTLTGTNVWETAGPLIITATPNSGYTFSSWSSNTALITFTPNSATTMATIGGTGTITATFTPITTSTYLVMFSETNLPSGTSWSVTLNGVTKSSTTTTITFSGTASGSYLWSTQTSIAGGTGTQYVASPTTGTMNVPTQTAQTITYTTQYLVSFTNTGGGSTNPSGSYWENAGSKPSISATANSGYIFGMWSSSTSSITFANSFSAATTATIGGPGVVTAIIGKPVSGNTLVTLTGSNNVAVITGGNDIINAAGATATTVIQTGTGNDIITLGGGNNVVTENSGGNDLITAGNGNNIININGNGNNLITVGNGANTITITGGGSNIIIAGSGNNVIIISGNGNNLIAAGNGANTITIGTSTNYSNGNNIINVGTGANTITIYGNGNNVITAGSTNTVVTIHGTGKNTITR